MTNNHSFSYGNIELGFGNFNLPPVLIGTIFYQGETIVDKKNACNFNEVKAKKRINTQKEIAKKFKIPNLVEISGTDPESMVKYLEFYLNNFEPPFVLGGSIDARIAGVEYLHEQGVKPTNYIYNAISNLKNKKEAEIIKKFNIDSVVILILGAQNMTSTQRYAYVTKKEQGGKNSVIGGLQEMGVKKIWIDGGVIDLESLAHILETQKMISTSLNLPVGTAPTLFLFMYSSPKANAVFHTKYRKASIIFPATLFSNFIFYGAIEDAKECISAAYQASEFKNILKSKNIDLFGKY
ncbi:MAG: hypothetical protein JW891_11300 [Candidatus Lokiarchaeota archaeon]|nr:hypothetical protein [Candidatus Lokiarchaeota archaeon]